MISGNNRQNSRKDLPLYLPGNGSLLIAVAKMLLSENLAAFYENYAKQNNCVTLQMDT